MPNTKVMRFDILNIEIQILEGKILTFRQDMAWKKWKFQVLVARRAIITTD